MTRALVSVVDECALKEADFDSRPAHVLHARTQVQAAGPKRCAVTELSDLEALTCFVHAVHATDACGSPLSAFSRETHL
jgi:hypothetical protein